MITKRSPITARTAFIAGILLWCPMAAQVDYGTQIQPIFTGNCALSGCHVSGHSTGLDLREGQSYDHLVDIVSTGYSPALRVDPFHADSSVLWHKVAGTGQYGDRMPLGGQALPQDLVDLIETWINEGAPEMLSVTLHWEPVPRHFAIEANTPNPFNIRTVITVQANRRVRAKAFVVDLQGRVVKDFGPMFLSKGKSRIVWDGRGEESGELATGIYLFLLRTDRNTVSHKMLLIK